MEKIYSKVDPDLLLHIIHRRADFEAERNDLVEPDNTLQCAALNLPAGKTFKPHYHIEHDTYDKMHSQESWVVISGIVRCILYDIDGTVLAEPELRAGDCSITLAGGHNYFIYKDAKILEFKSGPYFGQEKDKKFI